MKTKTFWITKYALTRGVFAVEARVCDGYDDGTTYAKADGLFCRIGKEAFDTESAALLDAASRAKRKAESARKQVTDMEKLAANFNARWCELNA